MQVNSAAASTRERLASEMRDTMKEAQRLLDSAADAGDERLEEMRDAMRARLRDLRFRVEDLGDAAAYRARGAVRATQRVVHDHPWRVIGIALAAGVVAGLLASRR